MKRQQWPVLYVIDMKSTIESEQSSRFKRDFRCHISESKITGSKYAQSIKMNKIY